MRAIWCRQRGDGLIEFALTLPVLMLIIVAVFDMGRAVYSQTVLTNAAREGARYGTIAPDDAAGIEAEAKSLIIGVNKDAVTVKSEQPGPDTIRVTVTYTFTAATPMIGQYLGQNGTIAFKGVSTMTIEGAP